MLNIRIINCPKSSNMFILMLLEIELVSNVLAKRLKISGLIHSWLSSISNDDIFL